MPQVKAKNYAYTSLDGEASLVLNIAGEEFEVQQFTGSWALNQVPEAVCGIGLGRNAYNTDRLAKIHSAAGTLMTMRKAKITFRPSGDYSSDGNVKWPDEPQIIFEGYYVGYGYQKVQGKVLFVVHLIHWLGDLGFTSSLSSISHPSNPTNMTFPGVAQPLVTGAGAGGQAILLPDYIGHETLMAQLPTDLWTALKDLFYAMSLKEGFNPLCGALVGSSGVVDLTKKNQRAAKALLRIEGGSDKSLMPYEFGKALPLGVSLTQVYAGMASFISRAVSAESAVHMTMWDVMIGVFCPLFQLDLMPCADRAIVAASLPAYRGTNGKYWRVLRPDDYDFIDDNAMLPKPLRAVVAHGSIVMEGKSNFTAKAVSGTTCLSGVFGSTAEEDGDGAVLYVPIPEWCGAMTLSGLNAGTSTGLTGDKATGHGEGGAPASVTPAETFGSVQTLLQKYAQSVFIQNALRGRSGTTTGRLRFDIAPGSHLRIEGSPEKFIGAEDSLAGPRFAQVNRVTVEVNCEARRACTAMVLSHQRNEAENAADRTSLDAHPFYGNNVILGAPLVPEYALPGPDDPDIKI